MNYKGIILDLDDTLYDYQSAHRIAMDITCKAIENELGLAAEQVQESFMQARNQIHTELDMTASSHNRLLYFQRMYEILGIHPVQYALDSYERYWSTLLDQMRLNEGVPEFLQSIQDRKVCILTDLTAHIQHRKILRLNLGEHVDCLVTSEEAGREKPHPYMFMLALQKMKLQASEVCMIGDSFKKDMLGAHRLDIQAYWYNPDAKAQQLPQGIVSFTSFHDLLQMEMKK
ncbi:HAD family hydrolase [Paenibacillus campi]|uniref:HAD family hydrolase n=1 Tax=Paenibacillus campi TaxID=3106031 RepID=UPI002AFFBE34|nr:HAD family hydrolase [Paenibacillus sp. SGZ-1014]